MDRQEMIDLLKSLGIDAQLKKADEDFEFSRVIEFAIRGKAYVIYWYANYSTLYLGNDASCPQILFKFIFVDTTFPFGGDFKNGLAFSLVKNQKKTMTDSAYPFEVLRIPVQKYDWAEQA